MWPPASGAMVGISGKRFNWINTPSAWQQGQIWRARQQQVSDRFTSTASGASSVFAEASNGLTSGMATIAAKAGLKRVQDEAAAKRTSALSALNKQV
jgi:hypothetical protein